MAVVEDVLATRLDLIGLGTYVRGFEDAATAIGIHNLKLEEAQKRQLGFAIGAGILGVAGFVALGKAAMMAGQEQADFNRASGNFKGTFPVEELQEVASELQDLTGVADDSIASFLGLLGTFQITGDQARKLALPILNASEALKAQGVTTAQLAVQVGKALQTGEPTALRRSGIILDQVAFKAADAEGRVRLLADALQAQGGDAAVEFRSTLPGALQATQNALSDVAEEIGSTFVPVLRVVADVVASIARGFRDLPDSVKAAVGLGIAVASGAMIFYAAAVGRAIIQTQLLMAAQIRGAGVAGQYAAAQAGAGAFAGGGGGLLPGGLSRAAMLRLGGGAALAFAGTAAAQSIPGDDPGSALTRILGTTGSFAGGGALVGSVLPGIGTAAGAGIGVIIGAIVAGIEEANRKERQAAASPQDAQLEELRKINARLQEQLNEQKALRTGQVLSGSDVPGAHQVAMGVLGRMIS